MNTLGSRLLRLRTEKKLTQANIASALGITSSSVTQWEQDSYQPRGKNLIALTKILGCDVNWLLTGQSFPEPDKQQKEKTKYTLKNKTVFPVVSWNEVIKFHRSLPLKQPIKAYYPSPIECSEKTFILKITRNNMIPTFTEGELIFVDPKVEAIDGKYAIAYFEEEKQATLSKVITKNDKQYIQTIDSNYSTLITPINNNCIVVGTVMLSIKLF